MLLPKTTTYRSKAYLKFVASKPCCMCSTPHLVAAHHSETGGMGIKCGDDLAVPLCFICHDKVHRSSRKDAIPNLKKIISRLRREWNGNQAEIAPRDK